MTIEFLIISLIVIVPPGTGGLAADLRRSVCGAGRQARIAET